MKADTTQMPSFLNDLLQPTPSGVMKLMAAWDGLSTETHILILSLLPSRQYPNHLLRQVRDKALDSEVPYIRYLSYRGVYLDSDNADDMKTKLRIESDPDPLVRYVTKEGQFSWCNDELSNPQKFFALPQSARLAEVRLLVDGGEDIAKIISDAVGRKLITPWGSSPEEGKVSETELCDILSDYLIRPEFRERFLEETYDGLLEHAKGEELKALWNVAPECPASVSTLMIEHIPAKSTFFSEIPNDVIGKLDDYQLQTLFYRTDVGLSDLRKSIFFNRNKSENLRTAATSYNFSLDNKEFQKILSLPEKDRSNELRNLATYSHDLRLCVYQALHDYLFLTDHWEAGLYAEQAKKLKLSCIDPNRQNKRDILQLRLYILARYAVPVKDEETGYPPDDELAFLKERIIPHNTWKTFIEFDAAWQAHPKKNALEKFLPRIDEIDPENECDETVDTNADLISRVEDKIDNLIASSSKVLVDSKNKSEKISEDFLSLQDNISHDAQVIQEKILNLPVNIAQPLIEFIENNTEKSIKIQKHMRGLLYLTCGLLLVILFEIIKR